MRGYEMLAHIRYKRFDFSASISIAAKWASLAMKSPPYTLTSSSSLDCLTLITDIVEDESSAILEI
jgi:hypothetical protein